MKINTEQLSNDAAKMVENYRIQKDIGGFFGYSTPSKLGLLVQAVCIVIKNMETK